MTLFFIVYLGGVLTVLSPCIIPIIPLLVARTGHSFRTSTIPMLVSMIVGFALVATLATFGGDWVIDTNEYARLGAILLLVLFGICLVSTRIAAIVSRPISKLGNGLHGATTMGQARNLPVSVRSSLVGVATGFLWAPCAGPILGLVLTGAALNGPSLQTTMLLVVYASGAASSLALALFLSSRVFAAVKRLSHVGDFLRKGMGIAVLAGVAVIALGLDTTLLAGLSSERTSAFEHGVLERLGQRPSLTTSVDSSLRSTTVFGNSEDQPFRSTLGFHGEAPSLDGAVQWLNAGPLDVDKLAGKVVLVNFWTYSCINCIRSVPYIRSWADRYKQEGLVVVGVHSPEFAFERNIDNVKSAVERAGIGYPVAIDNEYQIWRAFGNSYWPAQFLIDANGQLRYHHYGEGNYVQTEQAIIDLLREAGSKVHPTSPVVVNGTGIEASADYSNIRSAEKYLGYHRASNFVSPEGLQPDTGTLYSAEDPDLNEWGLRGTWKVASERAVLVEEGGSIVFRFHARDLHLVLGTGARGMPIRFQVKVDGKPPATSHGSDISADGFGTIVSTRLYQLIRQSDQVTDRLFEIRFLDPGAEAYAFTFG